MKKIYPACIALLSMQALATVGQAQVPILLGRLPAANSVTAAPTGPVQLTFSTAMSTQAASTAALRVVSGWRGQLRGTYAGAGTTNISFTPSQPLLGGEPVQVTLTPRMTSQAGVALSAPYTYQFQAAATGSAQFVDEDLPAGTTPRSVAAGDINRDGNPDFVANGNQIALGDVTIWLGDGRGGYLPPPSPIPAAISVGVGRSDRVALADVNGDGKLDLVATTSGSSGQYSVELGDGNGRFTNATTAYGSSTGLSGLAVGDVNEDGKADFIAAGGNVVLVRLGTSTGGITAGPDVPVPNAAGTALADVNGDQHLDILVLSVNTLLVRLGDGTGRFTVAPGGATPVGAGPNGIATGDVNEDGAVDVLTTNATANTVSVRLGNGQGGFRAPTTPDISVVPTPYLIGLSDFNRDGHLDFVTTTFSGFTATSIPVRLGDGRGGFAPGAVPELTVGIQPVGLALTDCNRDGQLDLLVGNVGYPNGAARGTYGTVSVRLSDGTGQFVVPSGPRVPIEGPAQFMRPGDFNNDGQLDLLTLCRTAGGSTMSLRLGAGRGRFVVPPAPNNLPSGLVTETLTTGDVNNDGNLDFVIDQIITFLGERRPVTYLGNGQGRFTARPFATSNPTSGNLQEMQLLDVTGDGNLDLITTGPSTSPPQVRLQVRTGDGAGAFGAPVTDLFLTALVVRLGDVNGDGKHDLLIGGGSQVTIRLGDGNGGFAAALPAQVTLPNGGRIVSMATTDLNGDGKLDFVVCNGVTGTTTVYYTSSWLGNGTGGFASGGADVTIGITMPTGLALGDLNGDGKPDLALSSNRSSSASSGDNVTLRLGTGTGGFTAPAVHPELTAGVGAGGIELADVDSDGDLDIVLPNLNDLSVSIRLNGSTASVLAVRTAGSGTSPSALTVYPNPAHGTVTVAGGVGAEPFVLFDLLGREHYRQPQGPVIFIGGIKPGLYLLRCGPRAVRLVID